jgi:phage terminase large subunit-like protein
LKRLTHGNTRILLIIMPNPKGHEPSIKDSRFKAAWQSGSTRTIRVPIALAEVTLEYARKLDKGIEPHDTAEMFDCGTDAVITEPPDTMVKPDSSTHNKVDTLVAEPHDTAKMQAELESIRANYDALLETSARITTKLRERRST